MGHPGLVFRDGFQYAYASFYTITIPFTGVMFLKRQWMLGKRFGYVTPGEMLSDYFQGDAHPDPDGHRRPAVLDPLPGRAAGRVGLPVQRADRRPGLARPGDVDPVLVVLIYVASGGLRAVAYVDTVQCILLAGGIIVTGIIALNIAGGWGALNTGFGELARRRRPRAAGSTTPDGGTTPTSPYPG